MRRLLSILCLVMLALPCPAAAKPDPEAGPTLKVVTFNLRFASQVPPNAWPQRRPVMAECIRACSPDVMGTQEGLYTQLEDLVEDLPEYAWIGLGRDGGSHGEFSAIFYRKSRLKPLEYDHFWLSDTPATAGSRTWGPQYPRMVTWARFRDLRTGREFYFVNTHFDHEVQGARERSASMVRERVAGLQGDLPVVLVGDFNAAARGNRAYDILVDEGFFVDAWSIAREVRGGPGGTFHNYHPETARRDRIDWILVRGAVTADDVEIVTFQRDGQYPSDHFPVAATLRLEAPMAPPPGRPAGE